MKKEIKENWEKEWHFQYPLTRGMKSFIKKVIQEERERIKKEIGAMYDKSNDGAGFGGEASVDGYNQVIEDIIKSLK